LLQIGTGWLRTCDRREGPIAAFPLLPVAATGVIAPGDLGQISEFQGKIIFLSAIYRDSGRQKRANCELLNIDAGQARAKCGARSTWR